MTDSLRKAAEMALDALDFEAREEPESIWKAERDALRQALAERKTLAELLDSTPDDTVIKEKNT